MILVEGISICDPYPFSGLLGVIFSFFFPNLDRTFFKQTIKILSIQTPHYAVSDLGLQTAQLPMSHKKGASLGALVQGLYQVIWVIWVFLKSSQYLMCPFTLG